jgi:crotonobetainyl-CoA:carnitine CoA-transferase CaiB-like acyl-CoA transferase
MAGPFATMVLGDMGAEVIKVEHPESGDSTRGVPGTFHPEDRKKLFGGYFNSINRNKKSVTIDLKTPEGSIVFEDLVESADVVMENFRRDVPERLGIDYQTLKDIKPDIIYCSVSGFGDTYIHESPYLGKPAFDVTAQAMGGLMYITSPEENGPPTKVGPGIGDIMPGMFAAIGIQTALWHRNRTGEGQYVDVAMYDSIIALCERIIYRYSYQGEIEHPSGNAQPLFAPFGVFEAKDGQVTIAANRSHMWEHLCRLMDREELVDDPRFKSAGDRADNLPELKEEIESWTTKHTKEEIFQIISDEVPCGPVQTAEDIFHDPHVDHRDMLASVEQPIGEDDVTDVQIANTPIKLSNSPGGVERRGPHLGEHNKEVLLGLGYSEENIQMLFDKDIIKPKPVEGESGF